jgi:predicted SprT family Zn-dependent metalloprotease
MSSPTQFSLRDNYPDLESYFFFNENTAEVFDVHEMFRFYDFYFFNNLLVASEVKWSSRMTLCAGTCKMDIPGSCTITLSKPLLQFRSNNELKETLIHEMIHGYLFITNPKACMDHGGHGVEFQTLMNNINNITGLNITVYHSFHDEVDFFRKHIWKCDGPCQKKPPFFGLVKRAMNRAPGPKDPWWSAH